MDIDDATDTDELEHNMRHVSDTDSEDDDHHHQQQHHHHHHHPDHEHERHDLHQTHTDGDYDEDGLENSSYVTWYTTQPEV